VFQLSTPLGFDERVESKGTQTSSIWKDNSRIGKRGTASVLNLNLQNVLGMVSRTVPVISDTETGKVNNRAMICKRMERIGPLFKVLGESP
jgi:hypothetical protein